MSTTTRRFTLEFCATHPSVQIANKLKECYLPYDGIQKVNVMFSLFVWDTEGFWVATDGETLQHHTLPFFNKAVMIRNYDDYLKKIVEPIENTDIIPHLRSMIFPLYNEEIIELVEMLIVFKKF